MSVSPLAVRYLVSDQGKQLGPFAPEFIEAMIMAGVYPSSVPVRTLDQAEWKSFSSLENRHPALSPAPNAQRLPNGRLESKPSPRSPETSATWILGGFTLVVVLAVAFVAANAKMQGIQRKSHTSPPSPISSSRTDSTPRSHAPKPVYNATPPLKPAAPQPFRLYRDSKGVTYRVSSYDYNRLVSLQSALTKIRQSIDFEEGLLKDRSNILDSELRYMDRSNSQSVAAYNRKVEELNTENSRLQSKIANLNREIDGFNAELARVGTIDH